VPSDISLDLLEGQSV